MHFFGLLGHHAGAGNSRNDQNSRNFPYKIKYFSPCQYPLGTLKAEEAYFKLRNASMYLFLTLDGLGFMLGGHHGEIGPGTGGPKIIQQPFFS